MAKLLQYKNPITGTTSDIGDFKGLAQMVLGVVVVAGVFGVGTTILRMIRTRVPAVAASVNPWTMVEGGNN